MKKLLGFLIALVLLVAPFGTFAGQAISASAQSVDPADRYFMDFVSSDTTIEGDLSFTHSPLYDEELNVNGRQYLFSIGEFVSGYALMIEFKSGENSFYEIEELFYNEQSPFAGCDGLPVYVTHNVYLEYKDQAFYDITTDTEVDGVTVSDLADKGFNYFGGTAATFTNSSVTVDYATKTTETYSIQYDLPNILGSVNDSSCANTAGAVIVVYYDRFCENLMPNFVPYITIGNAIRYNPSSEEVTNLIAEMSELMLIGEAHEGTTFSEFEYGMQTYATNHGYTYSSTNIFSNGSFSFDNYKNAVENNKPVAIFLTNFAMLNSIVEEDGTDTISSGYCAVSHVAVGCGYKIDTYYDSNNNVISTRRYLKVASGLISYGVGYLNINGVSTISKAISTYIS